MPFENRKQPLAPLSLFLKRWLHFASFGFGLIAISVAIGIWGYHVFAGLGWLDSFQMACLILTGMGPTVTMTSAGAKIFSSLYALYSGVAFLSICAVFFAPAIHRFLHKLHLDEDAS
jgi:hypothetical protein